MDNIDTKYEFLVTYAKKVFELKTKLKNTQNEKEKELLNSAISFYEESFNKLTNTSINYVFDLSRQITESKNRLKVEKNPDKIKLLNQIITECTNNIKEKIITPNKEISANISKNDSFRKSQQIDIDPITQAKQIADLCLQHQQEMKSKKQISENDNSR